MSAVGPGVVDLAFSGIDLVPLRLPNGTKELFLDHNLIQMLDIQFMTFSLEKLYLDHNSIPSDGFPERWPACLKALSLSHNSIYSLEDWPAWPAGLEELNVSYNPLHYIETRELPVSLKSLKLDNTCINALYSIPANLEYLSALNCRLFILPKLSEKLNTCILTSNLLNSSAIQFAQWPSTLRILDLANNALTEVPPNLPEGLQSLILDHNKIKTVKKNSLPQSLLVINLQKNRLREWEPEGDEVPNLLSANLADNRLTKMVYLHPEAVVVEYLNFNFPIHGTAASCIQRIFRRWRLQKIMRTRRRCRRVRLELLETACHPDRVGCFEPIPSGFSDSNKQFFIDPHRSRTGLVH